MNDDVEKLRTPVMGTLGACGHAVPMARVIAFDEQRGRGRERPLFAGWVGADGNVVSMVARARPALPVEDEWI